MACTDCHDPHRGDAILGGGTRMAAANDTCLKCHEAQRGPYVFEHEALRDTCTACHNSHGSVNAKMLKARNATLVPGDDRYRLALRQERTGRFYVDAGVEQFRVWYDGSGGVFLPLGTSFVVFNEEHSLTRRKAWAEVGAWTPDQTLFAFRWERRMRDGTKSSTHRGDSNLVGTFGTRSIVPSFYEIDEATDDYSLTVRQKARDDVRWGARLRYTETSLHNRRHARRRPFETADRSVTHQETLAEFVETNIGAGPAFAAILEDVEGEHRKTWDEFGGAVEVRHTGRPGWIHSAKAEWIRGEGNHGEQRLLHHPGQLTIDREMRTRAPASAAPSPRPGSPAPASPSRSRATTRPT
ncbi:MAG: cytochrome c3 family protein [Verrucomicrobiota bacterium]